MCTSLPLVTLLFLALWAAGAIDAQIGNPITSNPIPAPITKRGLTVEIRDGRTASGSATRRTAR